MPRTDTDLFEAFIDAQGPARRALAMISNKWKVLILIQLCRLGTVRFRAMQRLLTGVSQKVLTQSLRALEDDGFVKRTVYPVVPPRVEYTATDRATTLLPILAELLRWSSNDCVDTAA
jgi:DNA-binding HxlR family transcriptional regulator